MAYFIGVDLGGTRIKIALANDDGILCHENVNAYKSRSFLYNIQIIEKAIVSLVKKRGIAEDSIAGIGFSFPGLVNSFEKKVISTSAKFSDAVGFDWEIWAMDKFGASIYFENDARMACLGEWKNGAGRPYTDFVVMTLGTGVGTAVVMDGKLMLGKHFQAGNLGGHFSVNYKGANCACGNRGCVETEASTSALNRLAKIHPDYKNSALKYVSEMDFATIFQLSKKDKAAMDIINHCMDVWSVAVVNYIHAYDPEAVIIVGGVMNSKDTILPHIRKKVKDLAWAPWGEVKILGSELNDMAGVHGAVVMARKHYLENEEQKSELR